MKIPFLPKDVREPSLLEALIPIFFLVGILALNVYFFGDEATSGPNQIGLMLTSLVAALVGMRLHIPFKSMLVNVIKSISASMSAILILLLIGALAGTWLISGIVPAMIYYGLKVLNPTIFLFASVVVCAIVSLATGSSWSTVATVGIALLGIGQALQINEGIIAGAIISGAYFGDKISPMSDTTNLAPAMAGTDLFTHIRYMLWTTLPSIGITLLIFLGIGIFTNHSASGADANALSNAIAARFNLNPLLFLVPIAVIVMIIKKVHALPALLFGSLLGGIFAIIFQPHIVREISGLESGNMLEHGYVTLVKAMSSEVQVVTDNEIANGLLKGRGMAGMLNTVWLIITALTFGGIMEATGLLKRITQPLVKRATSPGSLVATTAGSCMFINATAADQYLSIVVPGKMYAATYKARGLAPQNLSRTLEDSGTVTSVLVPWNTCGATQAGVLGVATFTYLPYCFFSLISPLMSIVFAYFKIKIARIDPVQEQEEELVL
jgi:NhaC family Na+:H+ antiporter